MIRADQTTKMMRMKKMSFTKPSNKVPSTVSNPNFGFLSSWLCGASTTSFEPSLLPRKATNWSDFSDQNRILTIWPKWSEFGQIFGIRSEFLLLSSLIFKETKKCQIF
jgi:hypothetical protein